MDEMHELTLKIFNDMNLMIPEYWAGGSFFIPDTALFELDNRLMLQETELKVALQEEHPDYEIRISHFEGRPMGDGYLVSWDRRPEFD